MIICEPEGCIKDGQHGSTVSSGISGARVCAVVIWGGVAAGRACEHTQLLQFE